MKITLAEVEEIVNVLPLGYYCSRRVPMTVDTESEMSFYQPMEDVIHIAFKQISRAMDKITDERDKESTLRAFVYHELSHAIVSPNSEDFFSNLNYYTTRRYPKLDIAFNIFEDERIETIFDNYYLDVDFKGTLISTQTNNGIIPTPRDTVQAWFNLVRFRTGDEKFVNEVSAIIDRFKSDNFANEEEGTHRLYEYLDAVMTLYDNFCRECKAKGLPSPSQAQSQQNKFGGNPSDNGGSGQSAMQNNNGKSANNSNGGQGQNGKEGNQSSQNNGQNSDGQKAMANGLKKSEEEQNGNSSQTSANAEGNGKNAEGTMQTSKDSSAENTPTRNDEICEKSDRPLTNERPFATAQGGKNIDKSLFDSTIAKKFVDTTLTAQLETIITQFNKRNNSGNGMNAYSGVLNPRLVGREDWRIFEKPIGTNGNNKFGTFHLTLWLDSSGSFYNNEEKANILIRSLTEIEKRNKNFTLDVCFCNQGIIECSSVAERQLHANGGNFLDYNEVLPIFRKYQKPNTYNYNIVLFDGDCGAERAKNGLNGLSAFDSNNTTFILEPDNKRYVSALKSGKVIVTNNYIGELFDHITKVLSMAFH